MVVFKVQASNILPVLQLTYRYSQSSDTARRCDRVDKQSTSVYWRFASFSFGTIVNTVRMGLAAMLLGGGVGVGAQMFSNSIKKVPLSRRTLAPFAAAFQKHPAYLSILTRGLVIIIVTEPWMHVGMFIAGAYVGNKYTSWETNLVEEINATRAARGLTPLVGTAAWIRYLEPNTEK